MDYEAAGGDRYDGELPHQQIVNDIGAFSGIGGVKRRL
jgi:hypothetical protein